MEKVGHERVKNLLGSTNRLAACLWKQGSLLLGRPIPGAMSRQPPCHAGAGRRHRRKAAPRGCARSSTRHTRVNRAHKNQWRFAGMAGTLQGDIVSMVFAVTLNSHHEAFPCPLTYRRTAATCPPCGR